MIRCDYGESHEDARGLIQDLLIEKLDGVTLVRTKKGAVRGNHFHTFTFQWAYVVSGSMRVVSQHPGGPACESILRPGDLALWEPLDAHAWEALEDAEVMVFTRGPRTGPEYESDKTMLRKPLIRGR